MRVLLGLLLCLAACHVAGQWVERVPVTVFGDGDPYNGVEDSREPVMGGQRLGMLGSNAGAIECDGKVRGTAMVVDTSELAPGLEGAVLVTAAHVLYDLEEKKRFKRCYFHFMALDQLPGYRARIDLKQVTLGSFDPASTISDEAFGEGDWAFLYVPKPWRMYRPEESLPVRAFSFAQMEAFQQAGGEIRLIALDTDSGAISESRNCTVIESSSENLGGGTWKGQLLDNCDSGGGASGGGLVAVRGGEHYLIGIRTGSHWNRQIYPTSRFPSGPPDGSAWDMHSNTNFGRAVDAGLVRVLNTFLGDLEVGVVF